MNLESVSDRLRSAATLQERTEKPNHSVRSFPHTTARPKVEGIQYPAGTLLTAGPLSGSSVSLRADFNPTLQSRVEHGDTKHVLNQPEK